jgi:hypothetical protein
MWFSVYFYVNWFNKAISRKGMGMKRDSSGNDISLRAMAWAWRARLVKAAPRPSWAAVADPLLAFSFGMSSALGTIVGVVSGLTAGALSLNWALGILATPAWPWVGLWLVPCLAALVAVARWGWVNPQPGAPTRLASAKQGVEGSLKALNDFHHAGPVLWQASNKDWKTAAKLTARPWITMAVFLVAGFAVLGALALPRAVLAIGPAARERALKTAREWTKEGRSRPEFASDEKRQLDEDIPKALKKVEPARRL